MRVSASFKTLANRGVLGAAHARRRRLFVLTRWLWRRRSDSPLATPHDHTSTAAPITPPISAASLLLVGIGTPAVAAVVGGS